MFSLSPHRLAIFRQCPRRYKYHYVDGLYHAYRRWWPFYTMGAHVHGALSSFLSPGNRDRSLTRLQNLLLWRWASERRGFASAGEEEEYRRRALAQLRWFHMHQDVEARPHMIEATHKAVLAPDLCLIGKVDRVDREDDGTFHVIDYKTSKTAAYVDDFQLFAYALLLGKRYGMRVGRVSYLFLNGVGWQSHELTPADLARTEAELMAAREEILAERDFQPRPDRLCYWCDFLELCRPATAGEWAEVLEDEPAFDGA